MQMEGPIQGGLTSARKLWSERISCKSQAARENAPPKRNEQALNSLKERTRRRGDRADKGRYN